MKNIADLRQNYRLDTLDLLQTPDNPFQLFSTWFGEALSSKELEPNAMTLATVSSDGTPDARIVLLKGFSEEGFVFYTNFNSKKGKDLAANPNAALVFLWLHLERQIRVKGKVRLLEQEATQKYFHSRPRESQLGAWTSPQSEEIPSRIFLEEKYETLTKEYKEKKIPLPPFWGGYVLVPSGVEFWQGRPSRLHDRIAYTLEGGDWRKKRLAP